MTEPTDIDRTPDLDNSGSFAVRLWHARSSLNISQEELAARAGIPGGQTTIAHYEAGRREPGLDNLRRLVWALGESADYLLATRRGVDDCYRESDVAAERPPERRYRVKLVPPQDAPEIVRDSAGDVEIAGRLYVLRAPATSSQYQREQAAERLKVLLADAHADGSPYSWLLLPDDWTLDMFEVEPA